MSPQGPACRLRLMVPWQIQPPFCVRPNALKDARSLSALDTDRYIDAPRGSFHRSFGRIELSNEHWSVIFLDEARRDDANHSVVPILIEDGNGFVTIEIDTGAHLAIGFLEYALA